MKKHFVIIDTDAGTDDALALFIVLKAHFDPNSDIELVAITCVHGNTAIDNVTRNVRKTLAVAQKKGATKVPIFRGAESPLVLPFSHMVEQYHGEDGFGDVEKTDWENYLSMEFESVDLHPETAANAIIEFAHKHKGEISILALGPLTNLALAVRLDPGIKDCFKSIICMGGNIEGVGNCTMSAEFNFGLDPEAAFIVLDTFKCPITIAPWETCKREAKCCDWRVNILGAVESSKALLLNMIEAKILKVWPNWVPCDQIAAAALVAPKVVLDSKAIHCTVELQGLHTRGMMVMDHIGIQKEPNNVTLITKIDSSLFEKIMIDALQ